MSQQLTDVLHDPARLEELVRLRLLDTPPEEPFDRLTRLASRILGSPIALVSIVDGRRQFFKSAIGLPDPWASRRETPLTHSFCQHVVASAKPLVIENAPSHPLVRDNAAIADLNVIAYLGVPLTTPKGATIGSFCVIDTQPRKWSAADQQTMVELSASVMSEIALHYAYDEMHAANRTLRREMAERETLLRALRDSDTMLRAAQRLTGVGSLVLHEEPAGSNVIWSDQARGMMGIANAQPPTSVASFVERLVHPDDKQRVAAAIQNAMRHKQGCEIEYRVSKSDGDVRTIITAIEPKTTNGHGKAVLCTAMDITERSVTEAKLAEYRSELWHVARVATAGEMAAVMAHEINQPLAAISHTANACARLHARGSLDKDKLTDHLTDISAQAKRAGEILRRIRGFVRRAPATQQPIDLDLVVDDVLAMLSPISKGLSVKISRVRERGLSHVMGDEIQLGQLALNLVRNAFDAVKSNPASERVVTIRTSDVDREYVVLEVIDNGPGIGFDMRERIFEPFVTTRTNGLGMGLPISRTIAEAHQAELTLCNSGGQSRGARFSVVFPAITHCKVTAHVKGRLPDRR